MKSLFPKSNFWVLSFFVALIANGEIKDLGNFSALTATDRPKFVIFSQTVLAQNISSNVVLVYGNPRCGWTNKLIQELKAKKIPYQFKNLDIQSIRDEWNRILEKNGVPDGSPVKLPVVLVNNKVFMRPSIEQVIAQRKTAESSTAKIPNGWYIGESNTDAMIEIKNNQYCGLDLETSKERCDPISDIKYIKPGVVQLGTGDYFCSQTLFRINPSRYGKCTANGWIEK
ncbi:glutaredoxin [Microcystis aeruginosa NIES-3806]|uniref:glutaredoxin family protein n=1 Tax=Microcystis aeruginosa TaxID=1126 RepID=UPI00130C19E1|nr:glutaredoxin domain-containing protein [Microcystis aeruginosa]GCL56725.1 glutaredoxin [Microcystis aeruginosa NIES-3806]